MWEALLTQLLDCGPADLEKLKEIITKGEKWGAIDWYDVKDMLSLKRDPPKFNQVMYAIMYSIMDNLTSELSEEEKEMLMEDFEPYVNYLDSYFNNCLDLLDENSTRDEAIKCLKDMLAEISD